jgi:hypothetical protein
MLPFNPRIWAIGIFVLATGIVFGVFAALGAADALGALLSIWAGAFAVFVLYRLGYFAERALVRLPGTAGPHTEKLRRTTGGARLRPLAEVNYLSADEANDTESEIQPEDRVIGVEANGYAVAYPLAAMSVREVINDSFGDLTVAVSWWPVTYSARAFVLGDADEAQLKPQRKTLLNSTALLDEHGDTVVQFLGQKVTGPERGTALRQLPVVMTNWRAWSAAHPDTEVMSLEGTPDADIFERYYVTNRAGLYQQSSKDRRWHDKDTVLGIQVNGEARAYPYPALIERPLVQEELGGTPVLVLQERISATGVAFNRTVDGRVLTFAPDSRNPRRPDSANGRNIHYEPWFLKDEQTGSRWRAITGQCVSGTLKGKRLEMLPAQVGFWFAWSRFYPNAQVMEPTRGARAETD